MPAPKKRGPLTIPAPTGSPKRDKLRRLSENSDRSEGAVDQSILGQPPSNSTVVTKNCQCIIPINRAKKSPSLSMGFAHILCHGRAVAMTARGPAPRLGGERTNRNRLLLTQIHTHSTPKKTFRKTLGGCPRIAIVARTRLIESDY
jgi:hypothetical protein